MTPKLWPYIYTNFRRLLRYQLRLLRPSVDARPDFYESLYCQLYMQCVNGDLRKSIPILLLKRGKISPFVGFGTIMLTMFNWHRDGQPTSCPTLIGFYTNSNSHNIQEDRPMLARDARLSILGMHGASHENQSFVEQNKWVMQCWDTTLIIRDRWLIWSFYLQSPDQQKLKPIQRRQCHWLSCFIPRARTRCRPTTRKNDVQCVAYLAEWRVSTATHLHTFTSLGTHLSRGQVSVNDIQSTSWPDTIDENWLFKLRSSLYLGGTHSHHADVHHRLEWKQLNEHRPWWRLPFAISLLLRPVHLRRLSGFTIQKWCMRFLSSSRKTHVQQSCQQIWNCALDRPIMSQAKRGIRSQRGTENIDSPRKRAQA